CRLHLVWLNFKEEIACLDRSPLFERLFLQETGDPRLNINSFNRLDLPVETKRCSRRCQFHLAHDHGRRCASWSLLSQTWLQKQRRQHGYKGSVHRTTNESLLQLRVLPPVGNRPITHAFRVLKAIPI